MYNRTANHLVKGISCEKSRSFFNSRLFGGFSRLADAGGTILSTLLYGQCSRALLNQQDRRHKFLTTELFENFYSYHLHFTDF
jgi:hypothetical protein